MDTGRLPPEQQLQPPALHSAVTVSDQPFAQILHTKSTDGVIGHYVRRLVRSGVWAQLGDVERAVVDVLLEAVYGEELRAHGELVMWPSIATIARRAGFGVSAVKEALARLVTRGLLGRKEKGGGRATTCYQLLPPPEEDSPFYWGPRGKSGPRRSTPHERDRKSPGRGAGQVSDRRPATAAASTSPPGGPAPGRPSGSVAPETHKEERGRVPAPTTRIDSEGVTSEDHNSGDVVVAELLRGVGYGAKAVQQIAALPGIDQELIREAVAEVNAYAGTVRNRLGLIRDGIKRRLDLKPPYPPRLFGNEHQREEQAFDAGQRAADFACRKADLRLVQGLTPVELEEHRRTVTDAEPNEALRKLWRDPSRNDPYRSPMLLEAIAARVRALRARLAVDAGCSKAARDPATASDDAGRGLEVRRAGGRTEAEASTAVDAYAVPSGFRTDVSRLGALTRSSSAAGRA
jgi:hypothetical protein